MEITCTGRIPSRAHEYDAGVDLESAETTNIRPHETRLIKTGLKMAIPPGYCGMVCSRSGLALKQSLFVLNAPGIIDTQYRGEIGVILHNLSENIVPIKKGDRIAQLLILPVVYPQFIGGVLTETSRGEGGFGSSGA